MSNFLEQIRTKFNDAASNAINYAGTTYNKVSTDIGNSAAEIIPVVTGGKVNPQNIVIPEAGHQTKHSEFNSHLNPYEKQFESQFQGCFIDDPSNPSMKNFLGDISNISECIDLGRENNYKYVGIQQGSKCFGSNTIPTTQQHDRVKNCNVGCDDINTGNCGGFYFNQVYKTTYDNTIPPPSVIDSSVVLHEVNKKEAVSLLEKFINSDSEIDKINQLGNITNNNCFIPVNSHVLFFWILILVILIYLLFEYLYKKKDSLV